MTPYEFDVYLKGKLKFLNEEEERHQRRTALICTVLSNINRRKGTRPFKIDDFMPKKKQTTQDMYKVVERLNKLFGGEDLRNGRSS